MVRNPTASVDIPGSGGSEPAQVKGARADSPLDGLPGGAFAGFATGTAFHTDPSLSTDNEGESFGAAFDLAQSDAGHASAPTAGITDELGRASLPALAAGHSFARGRGIEPPSFLADFNLGDFDPEPVEAAAPPSTGPVEKQTQPPVELDFVKADSFEAKAQARAIPGGCVIGDDLARGAGSASDTGVDLDGDFDDEDDPILSVSIDDPPPPRAVSQSTSRVLLGDQVAPGRFGLVAETRQTIAPVSFGIPGGDTFTLEVGGEYVLRAAADGAEGEVSFGPEGAGDGRPAGRLFREGKLIGNLDMGDVVPLRQGTETVALLVIGDDPRRIGGKSGDDPVEEPNRVGAAADVATVEIIDSGEQVRVGHMEAAVVVPDGGIPCPGITVTKQSRPATVTAGKPFDFTITVANPNDCELRDLRVTDVATTPVGVVWKVTTTLPRATLAPDGALAFANLGALKAGESTTIRINAESAAVSAPGTITNRATATGLCRKAAMAGAAAATTTIEVLPPAPAPPSPTVDPARQGAGGGATPAPVAAAPVAAAPVAVPPAGRAPAVLPAQQQRRPGALATTGGLMRWTLLGGPLIGAGLVLLRLRRRGAAA